MPTRRRKIVAAALLGSLLFAFASTGEAEATDFVTLTSGTLIGFSGLGSVDVSGPDVALTGTVSILDLVGLTDCTFCTPGSLFNSFWDFDLIVSGTLTLNGVDQTLANQAVSGVMNGPGYLLPATLDSAFSVELPFTLTITLGDLVATGTGTLPVTFTPDLGANAWIRGGHAYFVGVPEPGSGWLLLGGLTALAGLGWLVRRRRSL